MSDRNDRKQPQVSIPEPPRAKKWWYIFVAIILFLGGALFYVQSQFQPPNQSGQAVDFVVAEGAGASEVSQELKDKELIKNPTFFRLYLSYEGLSGQLKAGKYYLTQGLSVEEIANALVGGDIRYGTKKFTIPEGLTVDQIADALEQQNIVDKESFLAEADTGDFTEYPFVKDIPNVPGMKHRLEGYLFPDTYEVFQNATAHQIVSTMLKQTSDVITPEWQDQMKKSSMTLHQTLTLASLVEREARVETERPVIAGVMENRLKANPPMMLQIDATVQFALGKTKETLLYKDLEIDSPYNTYKHEGLPPGPIAAPGRPSLQAALFPEKHEYLFYVTKNDGSGEHYFAKTFAEHEQNIAKSQ
ncbi:MAG: endolytic transglycosylase MltG [Tumebacillaceae bacterium]